jgi:hypothetical protein
MAQDATRFPVGAIFGVFCKNTKAGSKNILDI